MTNIQPSRSKGKEQKKSKQCVLQIKPCSPLNPRFGPREKHLPGQDRAIPAVGFMVPACCVRVVTPIYMLVDKVFRHRCSCGSQRLGLKAGNSVWSNAFAMQLPASLSAAVFLLSPDVYNAPKCSARYCCYMVLLPTDRCYWGLCPLQLAMGSYALGFPVYCNWKNTRSPGTSCPSVAFSVAIVFLNYTVCHTCLCASMTIVLQ